MKIRDFFYYGVIDPGLIALLLLIALSLMSMGAIAKRIAFLTPSWRSAPIPKSLDLCDQTVQRTFNSTFLIHLQRENEILNNTSPSFRRESSEGGTFLANDDFEPPQFREKVPTSMMQPK
jgi:hypothetical protein